MTDFSPINGQRCCAYAARRFGWMRFGTNGCGVLAIYNALGLLGMEPCVDEILQHFRHRPRLFGIFPCGLRRYFKKQQIPYRTAKNVQALEALLKNGGVAVVTYWNRALWGRIPWIFRGAHTVAVCCDGRFTVYNRFSNQDRSYVFDDLAELLKNRVFMKGFFLEKGKNETFQLETCQHV